MLRNNGEYKIYVVQHLFDDDKTNEWSGAGSCMQWFAQAYPKNAAKKNVFHAKWKGIFQPFMASGECWQQLGVHGSFKKEDAIKIMMKISEWNPQHRFRVSLVTIKQTSKTIVELKYEE